MNSSSNLFIRFLYRFPSVSTPEEAARFVSRQVSRGADYIKVFIEDGSSTAFGNNAAALAADERVRSRLDKRWLDSLSRSMNVYPQGSLDNAYASIRALRDAGVDILAGSDVSEPIPILGGLAHGASLHHELQLLVAAGLQPEDALRAATATAARRFGLTDRGRIVPGALADLLLVDGDPLTSPADTLSIRSVWHRGAEFASPTARGHQSSAP